MNQKKVMQKIGIEMNVLMAVTLSFFLSLTGSLVGFFQQKAHNPEARFSVISWLISFLVSTLISLIIGFIIPAKKVNDGLERKMNLKPFGVPARLIEALVSDVLYTPILSCTMVFISYKQAVAHAPAGQGPHYIGMLIPSFLATFTIGFFLNFLFMPLFLKLVLKKNGIPLGEPGGPHGPEGQPESKPED